MNPVKYCYSVIRAILRHFDTAPRCIALDNLRFYMSLNMAQTLAYFAHIFWAVFFIWLHLWTLAAVQPVCIGLYVISIWINRLGRHMAGLYLSTAVLVTHSLLVCRLTGTGTGFQYLIPLASIFPFLLPGGKIPVKVSLLLFSAAGFLAAEILMRHQPPYYLLSARTIEFFDIANSCFVFVGFATLATYLTVSAARSQTIVTAYTRRQQAAEHEAATGYLRQEYRQREEAIRTAFQNELEEYRQNKEQTVAGAMQQLRQAPLITDEQWLRFRDAFEELHPGFLERLKQKMPELSPAEIRFVVLSKLDIDSKEMAAMLGVGPAAIRKYRYRLRSKLNLPAETPIETIIAVI